MFGTLYRQPRWSRTSVVLCKMWIIGGLVELVAVCVIFKSRWHWSFTYYIEQFTFIVKGAITFTVCCLVQPTHDALYKRHTTSYLLAHIFSSRMVKFLLRVTGSYVHSSWCRHFKLILALIYTWRLYQYWLERYEEHTISLASEETQLQSALERAMTKGVFGCFAGSAPFASLGKACLASVGEWFWLSQLGMKNLESSNSKAARCSSKWDSPSCILARSGLPCQRRRVFFFNLF